MTQVWDLDLGATETLVMLCLADFASDDGRNCFPSLATIAHRARCTERHAMRVIQALEERGLVDVARTEGRVNHYRVHVVEQASTRDTGVTRDEMSPVTSETPTRDTHVTGPVTPMSPDPSPIHQGTTTTTAADRFDEFWSVYPRREAKQAARRAWDKVTRAVDPQHVIDGARRYRNDPNRTPQYTAHASTWLNDGRWDDDALPPRGAGSQTGADILGHMNALEQRLVAGYTPQIGG